MVDLEYREMLERDLWRLRILFYEASYEGREDRMQRLFWQILEVESKMRELDERD